MKRLITTACLVLLAATAVFSQIKILPESPKAYAARLQNAGQVLDDPLNPAATLQETLDAAFDSITGLTDIKGFNAAMLLPDGSYWKRAVGLAQAQPLNVPLETEHLMGMGSITKTFVSVTLLRLVEDGLIALDDPIGDYLDTTYPNIGDSITVRQLLNHRSGLNDYLNENPASTDAWLNDMSKIWSIDEILNGYVLTPNFQPDAAWSYSNTNFLLAGLLIEKLTGLTWYEAVRQKVIDPLGLTHTFAYPWETPGSQTLAHVFVDLLGNGIVQDFQGFGLDDKGLFSLATSAGCLITTPEDLAKFTERVFGGHLLQPSTLIAMEFDYVQSGGGFLYGLGAASFPVPGNLPNWGHNGDIIYKSIALYFPTENMSLAVQQNDGRLQDPTDPSSPNHDVNGVFAAVLSAYLNYTPPSAIGEMEGENELSVYPNPASSHVIVCTQMVNDEGNAMLYDLHGRLLQSQPMAGKRAVVFDLSKLPVGNYVVRMGGESKIVVRD